jgi:hypothetical protein
MFSQAQIPDNLVAEGLPPIPASLKQDARNGKDDDLYLMDPANSKTEHLLLQVEGGGWGIADRAADDSKLMLVEYTFAKDVGHGSAKKKNYDFQFLATILFLRQFLIQ